jgi:hypothetical protein
MRHQSHHRRGPVTAAALFFALVLAACGGDDSADPPADTAEASTNDEPATGGPTEDAAAQDDGFAVGEGTATVTIDGVTHRYATVEGEMTACATIGGSLQVVLPEVGEDGTPIPDTLLSVYLLGPEADPALHSEPAIEVELADGTIWGAGDASNLVGAETPPVDLAADGARAQGTVRLAKAFEAETVVDAVLEVQC